MTRTKRSAAAAMLAALSLLLTGCLITPGKFASTLTLNQDNSFSLTYRGEMFFLALNPGALGGDSDAEYPGSTCYDDETFEDRECTAQEDAEQRAEWESSKAQRAESSEKEAEQMAAMMGGINPSDPEAGNKMAAMLARQRGWNSVVYMGEGIFQVDYAINGQLTHDLTFPVLEGVPMPTPFIQVVLRNDNTVRVNAPGFAVQEGGSPMTGMLMGGFSQALGDSAAESTAEGKPGIPKMDGTFRIVTNGRILANNTDEGPTSDMGGETLVWKISPSTSSAPTALIRLGQ